jgi:hypothetical protein
MVAILRTLGAADQRPQPQRAPRPGDKGRISMNQLQDLQSKLGERAEWFRVGVMSATVLTPLVTRWQALRAEDRARAARETRQAGVAWPWTRARSGPEVSPGVQPMDRHLGLWLVGVGAGLVAAGTVAYVVARRRMRSAEEQPVDLPLTSPNGHSRQEERSGRARSRRVTHSAPESTAPSGAERPGSAVMPAAAESADRASPAAGGPVAGIAASETLTTEAMPSAAGADLALGAEEPGLILGDVRTLLYYEADATNAPPIEQRIYFASAEAAEAAGYRAAEKTEPRGGTQAH